MSRDSSASAFHDDELDLAEQDVHLGGASTTAIASLQAGHPFSLLLADDDQRRTAALERLLDTVADPSTRFARVTNPLRARLTLERLLIQAINGPADPYAPPAEIVRRIAAQQQDETRVILVIERAETLHPDAMRFFGHTAAMFPDADPRLQVLFVGRPEFRALLDDPESGFDEPTALLEQYRPSEPEPLPAPLPAPASLPPPPPIVTPDQSLGRQMREVWGRGLLTRLSIVGGIVIGLAAMGFAATLALTAPPDVGAAASVSSRAELPEPGADEPDPPVLQPGPPADEATAALRREFDAYLVASGKTLDGLTAVQKRNAYSEFLIWRARTRHP